MKRALNVFLVLALVVSLGAFFPGCGHGVDASPYAAPIDDTDNTLERGSISADLYAKTMVNGLARDILETSGDIIRSMGLTTLIPTSISAAPSTSTTKSTVQPDDKFKANDLVVKRLDGAGNSMSARGTVIFAKESTTHCALYSTLDIEYDSYNIRSGIPINGTGQARIIISSLSCRFYENVHADIILNGNFTSGDQHFDELIFAVDYEPGKGVDVNFESAEISYPNGILYCFHLVDDTTCTITDLRGSTDYCNPEESCEISSAGHSGCMSEQYEETDAHCNLGCCDALPSETNVCNETASAQRDCNPSLDTKYSTSILLWEENLVTYEAPIRCSADGLWTPPCPLDGSYTVCPHGGICIPPDDEGWGLGLEEYGYCSCIDPVEE